MRDYTTEKSDKKEFITDFIILDEEIFIFYADGSVKNVKKTENEIKSLLFILERQIKNSRKHEINIFKKNVTLIRLLLGSTLFIMLLTLILINQNTVGYATLIDLIGGCAILKTIFEIKKNGSLIGDIKKNRTFLENKTEIVENIKANPMVLTNTTKQTQEIIQECLLNPTLPEDPINVNDIDDIPSKDIDTILSNIDDYNETGVISFESDDRAFRMKPRRNNTPKK